MKKIITFVTGDLKLIFRDRMLSIFLFTPVVLILFVRHFIPYLTELYPELQAYHPFIMMFASMQIAVLFGFITAFMILDEKDDNVIEVIRVLPVSSAFFIFYRLLFSTIFSAFSAFLMITWGGIAYPGFSNTILLALQYGLVAPFIALIIGIYAHNKIEGMAFFKGLNLLLLLPVLWFFTAGFVKYVFVVIPVFWTYLLYDSALSTDNTWPIFGSGLTFYLIVLIVLFSQFKKRVFGR